MDDEGIHIQVSPRSYQRRGPTLGQNIIRVIFFLATLIPTCIIAWRIDLVNQHLPQAPQPAAPPQQAAAPQTPKPLSRNAGRSSDQYPPEPEANEPVDRRGIVRLDSTKKTVKPLPPLPETPVDPALMRDADMAARELPLRSFGELLKPSAIVPLTLEKAVVRVVAKPDGIPPDSVLCDVGFSPELLLNYDGISTGYRIVAEKLRHRNKHLQELPLKILGAGAAIELTVLHMNNSVVCEIRPQFSLPYSGIEQLTISRGNTLNRKLNKLLDNAVAAGQALPGMRSQLVTLQSQLATAQRAVTSEGRTPAETAAGRTAANIAAMKLSRDVAALTKRISQAEQLQSQELTTREELSDLKEIAEYARKIASVATIYVRFYSGENTIPASAN